MTERQSWVGMSRLCSPVLPNRQAQLRASASRKSSAPPTSFLKARWVFAWLSAICTHAPQLEELKAAGAARVEDGAVPVDKSLAEILAENKAKEEAEFKAKLDLMKQGMLVICYAQIVGNRSRES